MSISSINGGNNVERTKRTEQNNGQNNVNNTVLTKSDFTNSIMTALNNSNLNKAQISQFGQQANNIFSQIDNDPQDGKISQKEANTGHAILASFYEQVNQAMQSVQANGVSGVNGTTDVSQTGNVSETSATQPTEKTEQNGTAKFINDFSNATLAKQKSMIQQILPDYEIVSYSEDGTLVAKNKEGQEITTNIYDELGINRPNPNTLDGITDVNAAPSSGELNKARADFKTKWQNSTPAERNALLQKEKQDIEAQGYKVVSQGDDGTWVIQDKSGTETSINLYETMGISSPEQNGDDEKDFATKAEKNINQFVQANNIQNAKIDANSMDVQNHRVYGTGTQNGQEVKFQIDLETGEVSMQEDKSQKFDYAGFFDRQNNG